MNLKARPQVYRTASTLNSLVDYLCQMHLLQAESEPSYIRLCSSWNLMRCKETPRRPFCHDVSVYQEYHVTIVNPGGTRTLCTPHHRNIKMGTKQEKRCCQTPWKQVGQLQHKVVHETPTDTDALCCLPRGTSETDAAEDTSG